MRVHSLELILTKTDFDVFNELDKIRSCMDKSNKKLIEKLAERSLKDKILEILRKLKFESNWSIKLEALRYFGKEILPLL